MSRLWKKVPLAEAQRHPLYGVKNWLAVFAFGVLLGGLREIGSLNGEAHKAGLAITDLLAIDHPAISFAKMSLWLNGGIVSAIYWALLTKNPNFRLIASSLLLASWPLGVLLGVAYPFDGLGEALALSFFPWVISCVVWVTYLNRSKRVRVTFENAVLIEPSDELAAPSRESRPITARAEPPIEAPTLKPMRAQEEVSHMPTAAIPSVQSAATVAEAPSTDLEEALWAAALQEVEGSGRRQGLWARVYTSSNGNEAAAKAAYLRERVPQLAQEANARVAEERTNRERAAAATARAKELQLTAENIEKLKTLYVSGSKLSPGQIAFLARASEQDRTLAELCERFSGETLLHWCARYSLEEEASILLNSGANATAGNANGQKPYALAAEGALRKLLQSAAGEA
jgi:hypothetical protein